MKDGLSLHTNSHKNLEGTSEAECNKCLSTKAYVMNDDIRLPTEAAVDKSLSGLKSKTVILPLSLENNATLAGTGMILDTIGKEFQIPTTSCAENLPFDENSKSFSLKQARNHTEGQGPEGQGPRHSTKTRRVNTSHSCLLLRRMTM